jgi:tRNA(fMet)-specific endonuclease VapC
VGVTQRFNSHPLAEMAIAVISVEEQLSGWYTKLRRAKKRNEIVQVYQRLANCTQALAGWKILSFTDQAFVQYDNFRTLKLKIGRMDLSIAAIT